jgi:hypothetical protein
VSVICASLEEEFVVDRTTCERDVVEFLDRLLREGLIRVIGQYND